MQYPRTIRNFNAFVDAISYAGRVTEGKLPELKLQTSSHRGAGMDGSTAIDMGMEAMSAELTVAEWVPNLITLFGRRQNLVFRPAAMGEEDFVADAWIVTLGGRWTVVNMADLKAGNDVPLKLTLEVDYYRLQLNGEEHVEIDILAGKRVIGGVDQLESIRAAMGL